MNLRELYERGLELRRRIFGNETNKWGQSKISIKREAHAAEKLH